jgi:large subunit ribosomal protein L16
MLSPKKVKYRKQQKGRMRGAAYRGSDLEPTTSDFDMECGQLTCVRQRIAAQSIKRAGRYGYAFSGQTDYQSPLKPGWEREECP